MQKICYPSILFIKVPEVRAFSNYLVRDQKAGIIVQNRHLPYAIFLIKAPHKMQLKELHLLARSYR